MKSIDASDTTNQESSSRTIVCVYTQKDESFYLELKTYLSLWQREGYIQWLETLAGNDVKYTLQGHLQQADLILLIISPDFLAHDHCHSALKTSLQEQTRRQVPVVPVLARTSGWKGSAYDYLPTLPNEQPIAEWDHPERAYEEIRTGLVDLLPGDMSFRQKLMQDTARSSTYLHGTSVQSSSVNIVNVGSNIGHIGNIYGDVHNHR